MKTDVELLAAAAEAVNGGCWHPLTHNPPHGGSWNPLTDDGDAFRLLEALDLAVWSRGFAGGLRRVKTKDGHNYLEEDLRRAIVMAAAGRPAARKEIAAKGALQAILTLDEKGAILSAPGRSEEFHAAMQLVHEALT